MNNKQGIIYGVVVALVIFFVGWSTGMGGTTLPNIAFSILMGILATIIIRVFTKLAKK